MEQETKLLLDGYEMYKKELLIAFGKECRNLKDSRHSEKMRKNGNAVFLKNDHSHELHQQVLIYYNASAALAPSGSQEIAFAYANRSAFLLHVGKYKECTQDIQKALEITKSNELKIKLLCRKVECLKKLGSTCENELEEAKSLLNYIDEDLDSKQKLKEMVKEANDSLLAAEKADASQMTSEIVDIPETDNLLEKVSIRYDEKYGRHLVAEQNYNPGDIIFVEKLFSNSVLPAYCYTNCHYCLKECWNVVPCEYCVLAIFCSEDCRQEAWKEYHDLECSVGTFSIDMLDYFTWSPCSLGLKIFIKAMKDAGSVENLRAQLNAVDQCTDRCSKGFYKDKQFNHSTLESFCSLTKRKFSSGDEKLVAYAALIALIGLLKHPRWRDTYLFKELKDLIHNQDLVYLGSLLIKFIAVTVNNQLHFGHFRNIHDINECPDSPDARGCCIATLTSLINNSCCVNASRCFTEDGKIILYAVKPIEKNSQIFITYFREYYYANLDERKPFIESYDVECDCRACIESWPALLDKLYKSGHRTTSAAEVKFVKECPDIERAIAEKDYSKATLEKLIPKIILAFKCLEQPSTFTCMMLEALNACVSNVYKGLQPPAFGKCKKM